MKIKKPITPTVIKKKVKTKPTKMKKLFKKMDGTSQLEKDFERILIDLNIDYEFHYRFGKREFDFCLTKYKILVELDGDFYHVNEELGYTAKYPFQKRTLKNDRFKDKLVAASLDYSLIRFWENDIKTNRKRVIEVLKTLCNIS